MDLKIGELARLTGTSAPTIRYYEDIGLLPPPHRAGGQRRYRDDDVRRLTFVRRCRDFGFPIEAVRTLASLSADRDHSCIEARDIARTHLAAVHRRMVELRALEHSIAELVDAADGACSGGPGAECAVLRELARPAR
ncbi:putative transcriptional regulator [Mycolicibacterium chubuense NBB4]|uniref:Putative transcriptional regulator n=1 Tax=Mycolicibacterium chubuense (strain NBB4) TaxID=710421 RepID=I4BQ07_MYCCN|nr:MerR family transcriptional regulator [Mycolicibacterium chubuense]AFM19364.1 putative transcriptional regulator [Mycolicibacterium chubuense NBB4]